MVAQRFVCAVAVCMIISACSQVNVKKQPEKVASISEFRECFTQPSLDEIRTLVDCEAVSNVRIADTDFKKVGRFGAVRSKRKKGALSDSSDRLRQQEAKLLDIPFPLQINPIRYYGDNEIPTDGTISIGYTTIMNHDDTVAFYLQEMERLGWQKVALYTDFESLLMFTKPERLCSVSIRPNISLSGALKKGVNIIIFTGKNGTEVS